MTSDLWEDLRVPDGGATSGVDHAELLRIAEGTVYEIMSPSARSHLTEQVAADAIEQYLRAVANGQEIHNPNGWIKVTAQRRAIDAARVWQRRKKADVAIHDDERWAVDEFARSVRDVVSRALDPGAEDPAEFVVEREWLAALIEEAYPDDDANRAIAVACLVEGSRPRDVAEIFGMPVVLRNASEL